VFRAATVTTNGAEEVAGDPVVPSLFGSQMYIGDCPGDNASQSMVGQIKNLVFDP